MVYYRGNKGEERPNSDARINAKGRERTPENEVERGKAIFQTVLP
jgi:hypothetical protein